MVPSELKTVNHSIMCSAIHISDKFSQQRTMQLSYAWFSRHSLGLPLSYVYSILWQRKHYVTCCLQLFFAVLRICFVLLLFVVTNLRMKFVVILEPMKFVVILEPSCNPPKHGGAWWCRWNTARRNSRWVQQV